MFKHWSAVHISRALMPTMVAWAMFLTANQTQAQTNLPDRRRFDVRDVNGCVTELI